jgi:hypothetical protein
MQANRHQKAPNGHSVNIGARVMAFFQLNRIKMQALPQAAIF